MLANQLSADVLLQDFGLTRLAPSPPLASAYIEFGELLL